MLILLPVLRYLLRRGTDKHASQGASHELRALPSAWDAKTPCQTDAESNNARRNAMPTTSAATADDYIADVNCAAARSECVAGSNAFEFIREQAHAALNAIRSGCREDHNRIISRLSAADATRPLFADKPLGAAGWDADVRIRISRALAEVLAEAANEIA